MRILFLGDIVGKKGREVIRDSLSILKDKYKPDLVIANAENSAHGKGITLKIYNDLISYGIDLITMGNHTYSKKEIKESINELDSIIVPNNINDKVGQGYKVVEVNNRKVLVCNILGNALMDDIASDPFKSYEEIRKNVKADIYFVDYHGEATAEKKLFAEYFINDVDAVVGTHTHVQSADECILKDSVAYITDVGMCGPYDSIIGRDIDESIRKLINHEQTRYEVSESDPILCGVIIDFNEINKPINIERIQVRP